MKYMQFEDEDELVGALHLMDMSAIAVAVRNGEGENIIMFTNSSSLDVLMHEVTAAAAKMPLDAEIIKE